MSRLPITDRIRVAAVLLGGLAGCANAESYVAAEVPEEIAWYAALFEDVRGQPLSASELQKREPGGAIRIESRPDAARTRILGYTHAQLAPIEPALSATARRPLEPVNGCASTLPEAEWSLLIDGDEATPQPPPMTRLTGAWLASTCRPTSFGVDVRSPWCGQVLTSTGCKLGLDFAGCPLDASGLDGWRSPFGEPGCFSSAGESMACHTLEPSDDSLYLALDCRSGSTVERVEILEAPMVPGFDVDAVTILPMASNPGIQGGKSKETFSGPLSDLVALRDHVVVAAIDDRWSTLLGCDGARASALHFLSRSTLAEQTVISGPFCTTRLAELAADDEMVAFGWRASDASILATRFVGTSSVVSDSYSSPVVGGRVLEAFLVDDELVALISSDDGREAEILVLDPQDLSLLDRIDLIHLSKPEFDRPEIIGMFPYRSGQVIVTDDRRNHIHFIDIPSRQVIGESADVNGTRNVYVGLGYYSVALDRIMVAISGSNAAIHTFSSESFLRHVFPIDHDGDPVSFSAWPTDPNRVLVGFVDKPENTARIALMDPTVPRLLAGSKVVGEGTVSRLKPGPDGEVWGLLSWSGAVVRVRPR